MSSTTITSRSSIGPSRSLRIRTTPDDCVPVPYDEITMKSIEQGIVISRIRSARKMKPPLRTQVSLIWRPA